MPVLTRSRIARAVRNPLEALRYLLVQRKKNRDPDAERARLIAFLSAHYPAVDVHAVWEEHQASPFRAWYRERAEELRREPGNAGGTSSLFDSEALYLLVRSARPATVVETGVLYGASAAHVLQALEDNGEGRLFSIDFPAAPGQPARSYLIPEELQGRWRFVPGDSRQVLAPLLDELGGCDMFHHDSLHTFDHMLWEYETALERLHPGGVISSHDVLSALWGRNAFRTFCERHDLACDTFRNLGIAVRRPTG